MNRKDTLFFYNSFRNSIEVVFAATNYRHNATLNWLEIPTRYADSSGFAFRPFQFNNAFPVVAKTAFTKAYKEWQCKTNVAWGLDTVSSNANNPIENDGVSVVTFYALPAGLAGSTVIWWKDCIDNASNVTVKYPHTIDMFFDSGVNWYIDSTYCLPLGDTIHTDFWSVALHELGHAHLLGHVTDKYKVMYYRVLSYPYDCKHTLDLADSLGGKYITSFSNIDSIYCFGGNQAPMNLVYCGGSTDIENIIDDNKITIYPNPANEIINVHLPNNKYPRENYQIQMYDVFGTHILSFYPKDNQDIRIAIDKQTPNGIYIIQVNGTNVFYSKKVIINH